MTTTEELALVVGLALLTDDRTKAEQRALTAVVKLLERAAKQGTAFDDALTRTLLAVVHQDHPTVRSVADATGCSVTGAYRRLHVLRTAGLVTWEPRKAGTLRACVAETFPIPAEVA